LINKSERAENINIQKIPTKANKNPTGKQALLLRDADFLSHYLKKKKNRRKM
jgi:hypothetical protein